LGEIRVKKRKVFFTFLVAVNSSRKRLLQAQLHLILAQLQLILAEMKIIVAINPSRDDYYCKPTCRLLQAATDSWQPEKMLGLPIKQVRRHFQL
jgi:hypothetical protein